MKITLSILGDTPLMDIRYKYNSWNILWFITNEGYGSTDPGDPYLSHSLKNIITSLFTLLLILTFLADISMLVMQ